MAEPRFSVSEARDYVPEAFRDAIALGEAGTDDALMLLRAKASEVERLSGLSTRIFLSRIPFPGASDEPAPSWSEVDAIADRVLRGRVGDSRDLRPVVERLLHDRKLPDGSYPAFPERPTADASSPGVDPAADHVVRSAEARDVPDTMEHPSPDESRRDPNRDALPPTPLLLALGLAGSFGSVVGGGAGAAISTDRRLDAAFLVFGVLGLVAAAAVSWASGRWRRYVSLLLDGGRRAIATDDQSELAALMAELTRLGATKEATLLSTADRAHHHSRDTS